MLLSLETDSNVASLKMEAIKLSLGRKLPHAAAQKLQEILKNDIISEEQFTTEYNKIIASSETLTWKTIIYLSNLKVRFLDQAAKISPFQVGFILLLFIGLFFFYKKYVSKSKKRKKYVFGIIENVQERFYASLGYFLPIVVIYCQYITPLCYYPRYWALNTFYPDFMRKAVDIYITYNGLISWGYFFGIFFLALRFKIPRSRFVRFHIIRGLIILNFQSIPEAIISIFTGPRYLLLQEQQMNVLLFLLVLNLYFILPSVSQALRHTYPKNPFIREAAEVILGRDNDDPNFKWWDRDY